MYTVLLKCDFQRGGNLSHSKCNTMVETQNVSAEGFFRVLEKKIKKKTTLKQTKSDPGFRDCSERPTHNKCAPLRLTD